MWFYEEGEIEPIRDEAAAAAAAGASSLWLVSGPSDPAPMPMGAKQQHSPAAHTRRRKRHADGGENNNVNPALADTNTRSGNAQKMLRVALQKADDQAEASSESAAAAAAAVAALPELRSIGPSPCSPPPSSASSSSSSSSSSLSSSPYMVRLALVGATGLVGRACASFLAEHPEMGFEVTHFIGSALSKDRSLAEVAGEKEAKLREHYGEGFWDSARDVKLDALKDATVCDVDFLMAAGPASCDVVLSFLAPRFGHLEDEMIRAGFRLVSISPHARMGHPLVVPVVNGDANGNPLDFAGARCLKSPNCCSVGSSVALLPLVDTFTVEEVFITTFQTLSGRGDALYPAEKVVANVYPIGATEERTEEYIAQELARVYANHPRAASLTKSNVHVSAYRVYVQKNHLLDVRVRVAENLLAAASSSSTPNAAGGAAARNGNGGGGGSEQAKELLASVYSQVKYANDITVMSEAGQPRPRSHSEPNKVTVGNFVVDAAPGGGSMIRVSAIVDNVAKGAWGNAIEITKRVVEACAERQKQKQQQQQQTGGGGGETTDGA